MKANLGYPPRGLCNSQKKSCLLRQLAVIAKRNSNSACWPPSGDNVVIVLCLAFRNGDPLVFIAAKLVDA